MLKRKLGATLPDHIVREIEKCADAIQTTPTQYLAQIAEWWYGQNSPPVTTAEARLRESIRQSKNTPGKSG